MEDVAIQSYAKEIIELESKAIENLGRLIDTSFSDAVNIIYKSKGRVIITGVGKSAIIATKIVATLNSTGTPAVYMHAADAIHGDLGTILRDDVVICISKSGNTPEIKVLAPLIKNFKNTLIAITGNKDSFLGQQADFVLNSFVEKEACPNNLAPTTSTTAQLVIGDALAVCLLKLRGFSSDDFAKFHPGGALGKTLYLRVRDITSQNMKPQVTLTTPLKDVIVEISKNMLGVTAVIDQDEVVGIITDGDLRRMLSSTEDFTKLKAKDIMSRNPKTITNSAMAIDALELLEENDITQLIALDSGKYAGVVHLHNLVKEGII
ncbi:KpsF/GutQ family sugar-phosphate isomerase [Psychroflexus sp. CAK57W]|uniref:KpsF/GutQ family sugar-phosphate isomerase n=1 Tax=Psychroflexus curvus TaxID=2873595 RepID=UPI001CCF1B6A|nr:KpsF/GutQ family sugar-phosphate isomerase [Psychroflexus curvus]MBZ9628083.1 KpsF/GutQ family sugar-phosphate isomerase [Psychroflexus curvus]MBZ9787782.1 KpsF/GutQ family sugar-phosphate isomerase [Psychroflexus curvus]